MKLARLRIDLGRIMQTVSRFFHLKPCICSLTVKQIRLKPTLVWMLTKLVCFRSIPLRAENPVKEKQDRFSLAVEGIKRFEGWHSSRHYPYVSWGHCLQPGERHSANTMARQQADELLRKDLRKFCAMFRQFGKILCSWLRLPIRCTYRLSGNKKIPKSTLVKKLEAGDRNIYKDFKFRI